VAAQRAHSHQPRRAASRDRQQRFSRSALQLHLRGRAILPNQSLIAPFRRPAARVTFTRHVHHPTHRRRVMAWWWQGCQGGHARERIHRTSPQAARVVSSTATRVLQHRPRIGPARSQGPDLVVTGLMTNMCCETTCATRTCRLAVFFPPRQRSVDEEMHVAEPAQPAFGSPSSHCGQVGRRSAADGASPVRIRPSRLRIGPAGFAVRVGPERLLQDPRSVTDRRWNPPAEVRYNTSWPCRQPSRGRHAAGRSLNAA